MTKIYKDGEAVKLIYGYIKRGKKIPSFIYYALKDSSDQDEFIRVFGNYSIESLEEKPDIEFTNEESRRMAIMVIRLARKQQRIAYKANARNYSYDGTLRLYLFNRTVNNVCNTAIQFIPKAPGYRYTLNTIFIEVNIYIESDSLIRTKIYDYVKDGEFYYGNKLITNNRHAVDIIMDVYYRIRNHIMQHGLPAADEMNNK